MKDKYIFLKYIVAETYLGSCQIYKIYMVVFLAKTFNGF